ncbi:PP2C family protein-serine/threonine phosphatase, partial [Janibacter melonis]|uniref:PP2C family protein-serine/threonine phosphatase n=1 Tax=Janibacter melonis TaxID=262209 RepID=UPI003B9766CE
VRFLVCSDGLTGELTDDQVRDLLVRHADPQRAAEALVRAAVEAGGRDNVTVVVVDLGEAGADSSQTVTSPRAHVDTAPRSSHEGS